MNTPNDKAPRRVHVYISGRVQGVGFRYFTIGLAQRLGLCGWVRNLPDRRVEVELLGWTDGVAAALDELHRGPALARVDDIQLTELKVDPDEAAKKLKNPHFEYRY
jgi:acylphosphatase